MQTISLCIVVKNEAENLNSFLLHIKDLVDEIILVDTGSTDNTLEIAKKHNCKIFNFNQQDKWIAEARNFSLSQAKGDWILILDPDERIAKEDFEKIKNLINNKEFVGYYLIQRQYNNDIGITGWISSLNDKYKESKIANGWYENPILRFFINNKNIKFEGEGHETIDKSIKNIGKVYLTDIPLHHYGELNRNKSNKSSRYLNHLKKEFDNPKRKDKFFILYQISCELIGQKRFKEAIKNLEESLKLNSNYSPTLTNLGGLYIKEKQFNKAEKILQKALLIKPSPDIYNNLGIIYSEKKEFDKSIKKFQKAISYNPQSADAHYNLGLVYLKKGKNNKAIPYLKKAIELNPEYAKKVRFGKKE